MTRKVRHGVYKGREGRRNGQVRVLEPNLWIQDRTGVQSVGVLFRTLNAPDNIPQYMSTVDFLYCYKYVGKLLLVTKTQEKVDGKAYVK